MSLFSKVLLCIVFFNAAFVVEAQQEEFTSKQIKQYKSGIFEVVALKLGDNAQYKDEFPHHLLPFHIRKDKYHSLGTAFLIGENTFVSAAHVFNIGFKSLFSEHFQLRDSKGNVFKIKNVEKFSNYRDLIQFTVEGDTESYHTFSFAQEYEEGDVVYAAGNAHGEGVIFRRGTLTSFTYEPIDGLWKNIRYSAAASPGNSGGPLLNLAGDVVGIVTQKSSNENLNYALPIKEFAQFSTKEAEFFMNELAEAESMKQLNYSWKFNYALPSSILTLRKAAEESFYSRFIQGREEFIAKYKDEIFPTHQKVFKYLKNQANDDMIGVIDTNGNGEWALFSSDNPNSISITKDQSLYFGSNDKMLGTYQFILEKPTKTPLLDFVNDKKNILDTFFTSVKWHRKVKDVPVYVTSYGNPSVEEQHIDQYGRTWHMAAWHDLYSDRAIMLYCLPIPSGIACDFINTSMSWLPVQMASYTDNLHRMIVSYNGKLKEWAEFISLPKKHLPTIFHQANLNVKDKSIKFDIGQFSGNLKDIKLDGDSELYVAIEIEPENLSALTVTNLSFTPNTNEDGKFYVSKFYDMGEDATENYQDFWDKFTQAKSPYNFEVIDEGSLISKFLNVGTYSEEKAFINSNDKGVGYLAGCKLQSEVKVEELNRSCDAFIKGLH